jgi:hypothetical protein
MLRFPDHLVVQFRTMTNLLRHNSTKQEIQQEMAATRKAMERETLGVAEGFRQYGEIVNAYYVRFKPFGTSNLQHDFEDFVELVGHSVVVGNYSLISQWAVNYPLQNSGVLAQRPQEYLPVFKGIISDRWQHYKATYGWPDTAKLYWQHLISEWERCGYRG